MDNGIDALVPPQVAGKAEDVGVAKANLDVVSTFLLAMLAGAFIALGAVFSTTVATGLSGAVPFGIGRLLVGLAFSLGLMLVVTAGAELFTGNNLLVMAYASGKIPLRALLRNWAIVYVGNFVGAVGTAAGMLLSGFHMMGSGQVGRTCLDLAAAKCSLDWTEALARGAFCNALVCLAVWMCMSCRGTGEKLLATMLPVAAFVAAGFEHSVANMYFVPAAIMVREFAADGFWTAIESPPSQWASITTWRFVAGNLVPVTIGNIVGGSVMVGVVYWLAYRRPGRA